MPGWTYCSNELFNLECEKLFSTHWQYICHVNEITSPGEFRTLDIGGERAAVICGHDGVIRGFHNLCRHRGSRVVGKSQGNCGSAMVCPYHGWVHNIDGTLRGIARRETFPDLDPIKWGLKPLELEIWHGLVFIKFRSGTQPSVHELFARHEAEVAPYCLSDMVTADSGLFRESIEANWKAVRDVDNEGYHVPQAHPALQDLYGQNYRDEPYIDGTSRSFAPFNKSKGRFWSVRHYKSILPESRHLPQTHRNAWLYIGLFPNFVLGFYPDSVIYYREIPVSAFMTIQQVVYFGIGTNLEYSGLLAI